MAKRTSLGTNVARPKDAKAAAKVAQAITGKAPAEGGDEDPEYETVSFNLRLDQIDLCRDLAIERHRLDQAARREERRRNKVARKAGKALKDPPQARMSASAIVREAIDAHMDAIKKELDELRAR